MKEEEGWKQNGFEVHDEGGQEDPMTSADIANSNAHK
jgi:hypothetical protein